MSQFVLRDVLKFRNEAIQTYKILGQGKVIDNPEVKQELEELRVEVLGALPAGHPLIPVVKEHLVPDSPKMDASHVKNFVRKVDDYLINQGVRYTTLSRKTTKKRTTSFKRKHPGVYVSACGGITLESIYHPYKRRYSWVYYTKGSQSPSRFFSTRKDASSAAEAEMKDTTAHRRAAAKFQATEYVLRKTGRRKG